MDLGELDGGQRAAVVAADGPHLVVAGAGTGKTRTLVHRVAWLLHQGVSPQGVVLLTFTRRAAREMLDRVSTMVGPQARFVRGGTFHGFANLVLRRHAEAAGYPQGFTILDRADAEALVGLARGELALAGGNRRFPRRRTLLNVISRAVNTGRPLAEVLTDDYPQYAHEVDDVERVAARYAAMKRAQGVVDYDDLLVLLARLLREEAQVRRQVAAGCHHVLVDEYQDTNRLQAQIACLLASVHGNLMVVGDEAQSIYGFRGAVVENILDFPTLFPDCQQTLLQRNYRSTQPILDLANAVLDSARDGFDKRLQATLPGGGPPQLVEVVSEHEQADAALRQLLLLREQGLGFERQAVLFRSASHANLLEVALTEVGIPYRKFGGVKFTEAAHVKDVFALLRLVANPRDVLAWVRVLTWFEGLGAKTAQAIGAAVADEDPPRLVPDRWRKRRYGPELVHFAALLDEAGLLAEDLPALVSLVLQWYRERLPALYDDWKKRQKDLDSLALLAERFPTLQAFLAEVALDPVEQSEVDAPDPEDEVLTLSTIHSAKGLEWDAVHLLQLADGAFPSGFSLDDPDAIEEERRLLYVAVTRARRHLLLYRPHFVMGRGSYATGPGCLLLDELPGLRALVQRVHAPEPGPIALEEPEDLEDARVRRLLDYFGD